MAFYRFLIPVCAIAPVPLACSSTDDAVGPKIPAPPSGSSAAVGGSATASSAGTASGGVSSGGSTGGSADHGSGMACSVTQDCLGTGFFCKGGTCACSADIPDVCGSGAAVACVNRKTDPDNCGTCGTRCDAGATCIDGSCGKKPLELSRGNDCGAMRLALSGDHLYWTEAPVDADRKPLATGKVRGMPLTGGEPPTDIATAELGPTQIVADDQGIYWIVDVATGGSKILKKALPLVAGAPEQLKTAAGPEKILGLAVNGGKLYYSLAHDVHQISTDEAATADVIVGTAVNYDDPAKIEGIPHGIGVNGTMLAWTDVGDRNGVEGDDILAESATPLTDRTGYVELAQSVGDLKSDIAVDATFAYWLNGDQFVRNKLTAATPTPDPAVMVSPQAAKLITFAINASNVYASTEAGGIFKHSLIAPIDGDETTVVPPVMIARDQMRASSLIVDAAKVYWATADCAIRSTGL